MHMKNIETVNHDRITLEYPMKTSVKILFSRLSTAEGLSQWFADNVESEENRFVFTWEEEQQVAEKVAEKENHYVRYRWIDDENSVGEKYFEFRVEQNELTREVILTIIDQAEPEEHDSVKELWDFYVENLKRLIGSKN